jgi:hypothetical protein
MEFILILFFLFKPNQVFTVLCTMFENQLRVRIILIYYIPVSFDCEAKFPL